MKSAALRQTFNAATRNRRLVRVLAAFLLAVLAEYGWWIALIVYAFRLGGASEAALVAVIQLLPAVFIAPLLGARFAQGGVARFVAAANALGALSLAGCGAAMLAGRRPRSCTRSPSASRWRTASRGRSSTSLVTLRRHPCRRAHRRQRRDGLERGDRGARAGPLIAGILMNIDGPGLTCVVLGGLFALAAPLVLVIRCPGRRMRKRNTLRRRRAACANSSPPPARSAPSRRRAPCRHFRPQPPRSKGRSTC